MVGDGEEHIFRAGADSIGAGRPFPIFDNLRGQKLITANSVVTRMVLLRIGFELYLLEFDVEGKAVFLFEAEGGLGLFHRGEYLDRWGAFVEAVAETVVVIVVVIDKMFLYLCLGYLHNFIIVLLLLLFLTYFLRLFLHIQILDLSVQRVSHIISVETRI